MENREMDEVLKKAEVLIEALPYIQQFNRKIIVVKYGGSAMSNEELQRNVIKDVTLLKLVGFKPIIVHGGGKAISRWVEKVGKEPKFINGLRVTDEETMEIAEMVLSRVGKQLVSMVEELGVRAVSISGKDGGLLKCEKKYSNGEDIGFVGNITDVDPKIIYDLLDKDFLPIIAPIGLDDCFNTYNINADTAAARIAAELGAENLILMTDIAGLLRDKDDPSTLIPEVNVSEVPLLKMQGIISGGMIPKIDCCVEAVRRGVDRAVIIDGRVPHSILIEILSSEGIGTQFK